MQTIDLMQNNFKIPPLVYMVQNDTGRTLKMNIRDNTLEAGDTAEVAINRSDGSYYTISATRVIGENAFSADMTQALTQPGLTKCQLKVTSSSLVVSTYMFGISVEASTDGVPEEQLGYSVQDLMAAAAQIALSDDDLKQALLQLAEKVAYVDQNGQDYYDDLLDALYPPIRATSVTLNKNSLVFGGIGGTDTLVATVSPNNVEDDTVYWGSSDKDVAVVSDGVVTAVAVGTCTITATCGTKHATANVSVAQAELVSISAVYTQSGTVYDTDTLDVLEDDLVVTATYDDSSTAIVTDYVLSGTLTPGTSTITVTYGDKTTTFTVTVTEYQYTYITDGLIARYDGIDNTGSGHDGSATSWKDLVGSVDIDTLTSLTWADDGLVFSGTSSTFAKSSSIWSGNPLSNETIEIVLAPSNASPTANQIIASFDAASSIDNRRFEFFPNGSVGFLAASKKNWLNPESDFTKVKTIACVWASNLIARAFINNTQLVQGSTTNYNSRANSATWVALGGSERDIYQKYPFAGKIMAIRVYNRALTTEELTNNFRADNQRFSLGL